MKFRFCLLVSIIVILQTTAPRGYGDTIFEVDTGPSNAASWQFVEELSQRWQQKLQDKEGYFLPRYVDGFMQRLVNLDRQDCRLAIVPLKAVTEMPITDLKVKIAVVLWDVYLVPVELSGSKSAISLNSHLNWYLPANSYFLPAFFQQLRSSIKDSSTDLDAELLDFGQKLNEFYALEALSSENTDGFSNRIHFEDDTSDDLLRQPSTENGESSIDNNRLDEDHSRPDEPTGARFQIHEIDRVKLLDELALADSGVLFYEMVGPQKYLVNALENHDSFVSLKDSFITRLKKMNRLLESFTFSSGRVRTISITYALFVNEEEDIDFVKDLLGLLHQPPKTYFPRSYLLTNLKLKETREISPLFLHEGSIEYYNLQ